MCRFKCVLSCLMLVATAQAQPGPDTLWTRTYGWSGHDTAFALQRTFDGGFIVAGTGTVPAVPAHTDGFLIKTDSAGIMQGWRAYGGAGNQGAYDVIQLHDSGYAVAGYDGTWGSWIFRVNALGDTLWMETRTAPYCEEEQRATSIKQAVISGDTVLAVSAMGRGYDYPHPYCVCLLFWPSGHRCQESDWPFTANEVFAGNGAFYQVGMYCDASGSTAYVRHIPFAGGNEWITRYGGPPFQDEAFGIIQVPGGYVLAGATTDGHLDGIFLCKITADGGMIWLQRHVAEYGGYARAVIPAMGGGFVVAGSTPTYWDGWNMYLAKFNDDGARQWQWSYGGPGDEQAYDLVQTPDGGFVLVGYTDSWGSGGTDWYIVKTQPDPQLAADPSIAHPSSFSLSVFPNPFNPSTEIRYDLPRAANVTLRVFDLAGREVAVLKNGAMEAGRHRVTFDGSRLPSGIYFARLDAGTFSQTTKLVLLK